MTNPNEEIMSTIIVNIATAPAQFPAGTACAGIVIAIDGLTPQTVAAAPFAATFENVPPGVHHATAQAIDATGAPLGALVTSESFTVAALDVTLDIPAVISITVQ